MTRNGTGSLRGSAGQSSRECSCRLSLLLLAAVGLVLLSFALGVFLGGCNDRLSAARELEDAGDLAGAVTVYEEILAEDPDDLAVLNELAVDLLVLQEYDRALPVQERIVALDSDDAQTRVELGFNYLNHQDRPEDAVRVLGEAVEIEPSAQYLVFLAQAQIATDAVADAETTLRRAIEADPSYPNSYRVLAMLLTSTGQDTAAEAVRQEALAQGITLESVP